MFPLGTALLPGEPLPLRIFEPRYRQMLADCLGTSKESGRFGVVLIARGSEVGGGDVRNEVGTYARIENLLRQQDGQASLTCTGTERFRVLEWLPDDPYPRAITEVLPDPVIGDDDRAALTELSVAIRSLVADVAAARNAPLDSLPTFDDDDLAEHGVFGWAARLPIGAADRQGLLECTTVAEQVALLRDAVDGISDMIRFGL
ncbi:LON peptidase substrate-binding domain-containing protein [Gordonia sp. CPCC 205515]